jgi:SOS-response transcriptional repressor LexA
MSIGAILRDKRVELDLTQDELADMTGISKPYISAIETGRVTNPPSEQKLALLEKALNFAPGQLLRMARLERTPTAVRQELESMRAVMRQLRGLVEGGQTLDELHRSGKLADLVGGKEASVTKVDVGSWVPVINRVAAGYPRWTGDLDYPPGTADDYVRCPDMHDPNAFAARVSGDSMEPKYQQGDIVIFSPNAEVASGDDAFIRMAETHETNFKQVFFDEQGRIRIQPRNQNYPPQVVPRDQVAGLYKAVFRVERLG